MATAKKVQALSLHIGVNVANPAHYSGWEGPLTACEFDAQDMAELAKGQGIKHTVLLTKNATRAKTLAALRSAAKTLKKGDYFLLTFSGHGGQLPDVDNEEADERDETWCLYDGQLIDDEFYMVTGADEVLWSRTVLRAPSPPAARRRAGCPSPLASASTARTRLSTTSCSATARRPAAAARSTPTRPWPTSASAAG